MPDLSVDPYDLDDASDPYAYFRELRATEPIYFNQSRQTWWITKWRDVHDAFHDPRRFSSVRRAREFPYPMVVALDPPHHGPVRRALAPMMQPQVIREIEERLTAAAGRRFSALLGPAPVDFVQDIVNPLVAEALAWQIGFPEEDALHVAELTMATGQMTPGQREPSTLNMTGYRALARYFERLAARKRACRGDGSLIACLTRAEADGVVNHAELIGNLIFFSAAAYQTTRMMAGALARLLWLFPDQRGPLIATPAHIAAAIEEGLRMEGPVHVVNRILTEDVTLRGVTMRSGQRVGLCVASANRCEEKFADGDTFDITRGRTDSLAFGSGIHACLGGAVARRTLRLLFQHLLSVAPDYVIEPDRTRFCVGQVGAGEDFLWGLAALPMSRSSLGAAPAVA